MYCNFNYYVIQFFFKFVVHKINFKIIKSKIYVLIGREKTDVDVTIS
jgi:hypothetical protein